MSWQEEYQSKFISAEEAANLVKSGDRVVFPLGRETLSIALALCARKEELRDVEVLVPTPSYDLGWYDPGWQDSFKVIIQMPTAVSQAAVDNRTCDVVIAYLIPDPMRAETRPPDVAFVEVSPPDRHGFCGFGASLWDKKRRIRQAKIAVAEVNKNLIRTYGDNFIHTSEIDHFVEHIPSGGAPGMGSLAGRALKEPEPYVKDIAGYVNTLVRDGDTVQIGVGRTNEPLVRLGMFEGKHDLGYHSQATPPGIISLVREGVINGRKKTLNPGVAVVTSIGGSTRDEMEWVHENPLFHLVDVQYLEDIRVIAAHDNYLAINQALFVDLTGQIAAESVGPHLLAPAGGQIPFVFGALLSNGGRAVTVLPSTARGGTLSRVVPALPEGTVVTIQRNCADIVVTEYGIAHLRGRTIRERAEALISVAHPDFRTELRKEAQRLFWP